MRFASEQCHSPFAEIAMRQLIRRVKNDRVIQISQNEFLQNVLLVFPTCMHVLSLNEILNNVWDSISI